MFRDWPRLLPRAIEQVAIQMPGRENRLAEPPFDRMEPIVAALLPEVEPLLDEPFACYGSSMGARVALSLTRALRDRGLPQPRKLFVASSSAPSLRTPVRGWDEPDAQLIAYLRELGGTPAEMFDNSELQGMFLPLVRADLTVIGTCGPAGEPPLSVPIRAFAGADDIEASPARMAAWQAETTGEFSLDVLPGGHFFTLAGQRRAVDLTAADIMRELEATATAPRRSPIRCLPSGRRASRRLCSKCTQSRDQW